MQFIKDYTRQGKVQDGGEIEWFGRIAGLRRLLSRTDVHVDIGMDDDIAVRVFSARLHAAIACTVPIWLCTARHFFMLTLA